MTPEEQTQYAKVGMTFVGPGVGMVVGAFHGVLAGSGAGLVALGAVALVLALIGPDA